MAYIKGVSHIDIQIYEKDNFDEINHPYESKLVYYSYTASYYDICLSTK